MALQTSSPWILASSLLLGLGACGDDTVDSATATATATDSGKTSTGPSTGEPGSSSSSASQPTTSAGEGTVSDSGTTAAPTSTDTTPSSTSEGPSTGTTAGVDTDTGPGTATTDASTGTGAGTTEAVLSTGSSTGDDTTGGPGCEVKCGENSWSYVWIANSVENTVSKLDTRMMTEVGRYYTRPDQQGSPSRTSVSIDGKAVVVANRHGGITKIWSRPEYCTDKNNNGKIDTSTGKNNVLPFDQDECIAWYTAFPNATTQRPVAWTSGIYNEQNCEYEDQQIWTAASYGANTNSPCQGAKGITVYRLNGDTGMIDDTVELPNVTCGALGAYGAAVDNDNNVWFFVFGGGIIFRVDHQTLAHEVVNKGFYGITVDNKSRVWLDDGSRYDPQTKTWAAQIGDLQPNGGSGVAVDLKGRVWHATNGGLGWLDSETMVVGGKVMIPNNGFSRGIGVDVDGYIWSVPLGGTVAHRIDPETFEIATYNGLNSPYTYSDMAGGQINNVVCPQ